LKREGEKEQEKEVPQLESFDNTYSSSLNLHSEKESRRGPEGFHMGVQKGSRWGPEGVQMGSSRESR